MTNSPYYSLVMLVENAESDFLSYLSKLGSHLKSRGLDHELVLAVNGQHPLVRNSVEKFPIDTPVKIIELTRKVPSGICLQSVLPECKGQILIICGPYQQITDSGLDALIEIVSSNEVDMALPWRQNRIDASVNQRQSCFFNWLVRRLTSTAFHDLSSTLRVLNRNILDEARLYGDLYRYLPITAVKLGFRVQELPLKHAEERGPTGYFGIREYFNRFFDLLSVHFNYSFSRKPLRYFGFRGLLLLLLGILCLGISLTMKFTGSAAIGNSPVLIIGLVLILAGSSIWGVGLLGEIITFVIGRKQKDYFIEKILL